MLEIQKSEESCIWYLVYLVLSALIQYGLKLCLFGQNVLSVYLLGHSGSAVLNGLLRVGPGEDHDGIELGVVQLVHGVGGHVQQGVLPLVHDVPDGGESHYPGLAALAGAVQL